MRIIATVAAGLALALAAPAHAGLSGGLESYEPRDECRSDPELAAFLDALGAAVDAHDTDTLLALSTPDIGLDFGGGSGREELRFRLDGEEQWYGDLWKELDTILSLGCSNDGDGLVMLPWYWGQDFGDLDAFSTMLPIRPDVEVHATSSESARVLRTLHWEAVVLAGDYDPDAKYLEIELDGGKTGFVEASALRSIIDYRLLLEKTEEGEWQISTFIAGD